MKTCMSFIMMISICFAAESIPFETVQNMVDNFVGQRYGAYHLDDVLTYYGHDEMPNAFCLIYKHVNGQTFTIVAGARWTCTPIAEFSKNLPNFYRTLDKAEEKAISLCGSKPAFRKIYYFGPEEEYFLFATEDKEILINTYSMEHHDKSVFFNAIPERDPELEKALRAKWNNYLKCADFRSRQTGYIPGVPYCLWSYGCSPTASAMLFWYYDINGYGDLVDHFYDRWDSVENEYDYNLPNVQKELAIGMNTDSTTGGTNPLQIRPGHLVVANNIHGYSFTSSNSSFGGPGNQYVFGWIRNEIDAGRPFHWGLWDYYYGGSYINHSVCGVGYNIVIPDTFVTVHNTWTTGEYDWALWTYYGGVYSSDLVVTLVPGGSNPDNVDLTWPTSSSTWMFRGLKYRVTWTSQGSSTDHLKMWLAPAVPNQGYDSTYWTVLENSVSNTGSYIYNVPDETLHHRINLVALDASNGRLAADGSQLAFDTRTVLSSNVTLYGHNLMAGNAQDVVAVGNYAYVTLGDYGLGVVNISDSTLPIVENMVDIGGSPKSVFYNSPYLYCATYVDSGFKVLDISDPVNPSVIGSTFLANETFGIYVASGLAYVTTRTSGLRIVDVSTPTTPGEIGSFDTRGQSYDVCVVHDSIAIVADGTRDLIFLNVGNPMAPESLFVVSTPGIPKGIWYDGYLFVGDGPGGVGIMDVSDPMAPVSLAWYDSPGQIYQGARRNNVLYIADGPSGLRVLNISDVYNPTEIGYLDSYGNANAIAMLTPTMYVMADGDDGFYIMGSTVGIVENNTTDLNDQLLALSPNPFTENVNLSMVSGRRARIKIVVFDVIGKRVKEITNQIYDPGTYTFSWNGTDNQGRSVAQGIYFIEIQNGSIRHSDKVIFVH